jgi:hypothetical protein
MNHFRFLDTLSKRFIFPDKRTNNKKFHYEIEKDKECILNYYRNETLYKDKIDKMEMKSRGNFFYKSLVKKPENKKTRFIQLILKSISSLKKPQKTVDVSRKHFNISKLESARRKKNKMDILLKSRESGRKNYKSITNDNDIIIYPGKKSLESIKDSSRNIKKINILNDKKTFSGIKNYSENNGNLKNNISRSFSMNSIVSKNNGNELNKEEKRLFQFNSIINSCKKEIKSGDILGGKMGKFTKRFNKKLSIVKRKRDNKVDNNIQDQKILEDKIKSKQKYKLLEIEKFKELKRKINAKISDNYIYFNRKEYTEMVNEKKKYEEYDLYYDDINKINEKILENKAKAKTKFEAITNLLEDSYKKHDYLKNKISIYNFNNKNIQFEKEEDAKNNIELLFNEEQKSKKNLGTLVDRLLIKKKENLNKS